MGVYPLEISKGSQEPAAADKGESDNVPLVDSCLPPSLLPPQRKLPNPKIKLAAGNRRSSRPRAATARAAKQSQSQQSSEAESDDNNDDQAETIQRLQQDIESLRQSNTDLSDRLQILTNEHDRVLGQVALLRNRVDEQQRIIEEFIAMISSQQNGTVPPANTISTLASVNVAGASQMLQHLQHHSHGHHDGNTPPIGNGHGPDHLHDHVHGHDHDSEHGKLPYLQFPPFMSRSDSFPFAAIMKQAEVQRHRADDYGAFPPALTPDTPSPTYPYASNHQYSIHAANLAYQQFQIKQEESRGLTPPLSASSSISRQNSSLSPSSQQYQQQYDNLNILNSPATSQSDRDDSPFGNVDMIDASATIVPSQV